MSLYKKEVYCPLCKKIAPNVDLWIETDVGNILRCKKCGLGFLNPKDQKIIENSNSLIYNTKSYYKLLIQLQHQLIRRYKNQVKEISKFVKQKGKLIDIGCSIGIFLDIAKSHGFEPYGYDINTINLEKAKKFFGINILRNNFLEDQKFDNFFEIATMWDVLEHMRDPVDFLSKLIQKIKPGGFLVVQCPNMDSYEFLKFGKNWNWLTPGDHVQFFTPTTLIKVLTAGGFRPIRVKTWIDGLTFAKAMLPLHNKDPTFILNRFILKILDKGKNLLHKLNINIPIERIQGLYGWILQMTHHAKKRDSLIKVYAIRPK